MKSTLSLDGQRIINIVRKKLAYYPELLLVTQHWNYNLESDDEKLDLDYGFFSGDGYQAHDRKCGCVESIMCYKLPIKKLNINNQSVVNAAKEYLEKKLSVPKQYLEGLVDGFDSLTDVPRLHGMCADYQTGFIDGFIIQQRLVR